MLSSAELLFVFCTVTRTTMSWCRTEAIKYC